ncbi:MAG: ISNCY family transposase [Sulfurovaceae bacterium]|nr:ISNCY family transposase [Sulfurovaceae bacterium]
MKKHKKSIFEQLIVIIKKNIAIYPDIRESNNNTKYTLEEIILSAFALFFFQSSSWLEFQTKMQKQRALNNARSLFGIKNIPTSNHISAIIDELDPKLLSSIFDDICYLLVQENIIKSFEFMGKKTLLVAVDGMQYYSSKKIHCSHCLTKTHGEKTTYSHSAMVASIVSPDYNQVLPLMPEFIRNEDGKEKQDCELNASKRWLKRFKKLFEEYTIVILGDDLFAHEPFIEATLEQKHHFILVAKDTSHKTMYKYIEDNEPNKLTLTKFEKHQKYTYIYRYLNGVPIKKDSKLKGVNWCEVTIYKGEEQVYFNCFITDIEITDESVEKIAKAGRSRWKIENENNNILKTKGYHLEHNFGHGKMHLSEFLFTFNILSYLVHTTLFVCDTEYKILYEMSSSRQVFFQDIKSITKFLYFPSWDIMLDFMIKSLNDEEVDYNPLKAL